MTSPRSSARYGGGASPVVPGLGARGAALRLLDAVLRRGQRLDVAFDPATRVLATMEDKRLALALASEVLRRLPDLDTLIDSATERPLPDDAKVRTVLRIALVQALSLGTPPHAVVATALPLLSGGPRRLAHGVFGALTRQNASLPDIPALPPLFAARWRRTWGDPVLDAAGRAIGRPPPLDLRLRCNDGNAGLEGESRMPGHRRLPRGSHVASLPGYAEGRFWVQNLSAQIPALLLGPGRGRVVLDLCAAPGGKTMQLAAAGWQVTAVDSNGNRLARLRENLARTRLEARIIEADVMAWSPPDRVDAILLDAPCTSTGVFARHPDVLHRIGPADIAALSALQARMLARVSHWLKPGGQLVYATCSLEPEEGEEVVGRSGLIIDPMIEALPFATSGPGWLRILPAPGQDGFFVARLMPAG